MRGFVLKARAGAEQRWVCLSMSRGGKSETISKSESGLGTDLSEVQSPRSASWRQCRRCCCCCPRRRRRRDRGGGQRVRV
ncbi:hypothetical protein OH76DRAFT_736238 [Lentinus brumalis]|uniref:Uncharacterized protein n=1 Tax=Lentinus brumalis TaxID=2498619 RepID=A0A371DS59_9APHY|nr:hypothetical protein OH76DRAFT_736238 [Polyporus brumalis]